METHNFNWTFLVEKAITRHYRTIIVSLLAAYAVINLYCTTRLSVTGDEANYYQYGVNVLKQQPQKDTVMGIPVFNSQMPIVAINVLPRALQQVLNPSLKHDQQQTLKDISHARFFSVGCALLLALYVLQWSTRLYGKAAGIFSLLLYMLCPNLLAHSQMVSTDVYSFLLCTATCYHCWRYAKTREMTQLLFTAALLAIGQISKQSLLLLYPVIIIFLLVRVYRLKTCFGKVMASLFKEFSIILVVSLAIINAGFLFYKTGTPLRHYRFISGKFVSLQRDLSFIAGVPIPLPQPYMYGFDYVAFNTETPPGINGISSYGTSYFLGRPVTGKRIWYYYAVCCLYKLPMPFMILFFSAILFYWRYRKKFVFLKNEVYLLLPALFIFILFSWFNTMYLGIKNILMVLPLLFIFCGSLATVILKQQKGKMIAAVLLTWQSFSVLSHFPHFLPYTNEFIIHKKDAYQLFGDSNLYFQEGAILLAEYLKDHPGIQFEPKHPVHGKVMVSLENYFDFWHEGRLQWLTHLKPVPVGHFHSQYLIFELP